MPGPPEIGVPTTDELRVEAANWLELQKLYHLLETTPVEQQTAMLEAATADPLLRERVLSLLATAAEPGPHTPTGLAGIAAGAKIGSYLVLSPLGSGGVGSVYLVERTIGGAVQQCALKLLANRPTDVSFRARFAREQQILATLEHPNITHLLDAGMSELAQPYLVMEYVDGCDLTTYCDQRKLSLRQRVEIFLTVCEAVAYAHSKLVVHLDLKPSNVLVTRDGVVKLLDFGTSKLIGPEDGNMTTTVLATPAYASPEQMRGEPVTTSCDLYSLGAMLYELLAGQRPFATASTPVAINRASTEKEPPRLTSAVTNETAESLGMSGERLRRLLRGDLASMVALCLRSRARDRYSSVEALAADLRRYLSGRPVQARRQTTTYRLTKFVRRHGLALSLSVLILSLLLGAWGYAYNRQQQAREEARRAEQMQRFFGELFGLANTHYGGKTATTVSEFLQLGVRLLPEFIQDPADQRAGQLRLAQSMMDGSDFEHALPVYKMVAASAKSAGDAATEAEADAGGGYCAFAVGQTTLAAQMTERALSLETSEAVTPQVRVAIIGRYVQVHEALGLDRDHSISLLRRAVAESRKPGVVTQARYYIVSVLANQERMRGDLADADHDLQEAAAIAAADPHGRCDEPEILANQGMIKSMSGNDAAGVPILQKAYSEAVACYGAESRETLVIEGLDARTLARAQRAPEAIALLESSLPSWRKAVGTGPEYAGALVDLARAYLLNGEFGKGEANAQEALTLLNGKATPGALSVAAAHLVLAQNLAGDEKLLQALGEVAIADNSYTSAPALSVSEKMKAAEAHALLLKLQGHAR